MDIWCSSFELAKDFTERKLTMVSSMRKDKVSIHPQLLKTKGKQVLSSHFIFAKFNHGIVCPKEKRSCNFAFYHAHTGIS
jgi:hypothetical protein